MEKGMISQKEMLDIIWTEALEESCADQRASPAISDENQSVRYDLGLVREPDGTLVWED